MYSPRLNTDEINMARRILFTRVGRSLENIPPTAGALKQHILRSSLFFSKDLFWKIERVLAGQQNLAKSSKSRYLQIYIIQIKEGKTRHTYTKSKIKIAINLLIYCDKNQD